MNGGITLEFISILMESPFYSTLPAKEQYFLLSILMENFQSVINEYNEEKVEITKFLRLIPNNLLDQELFNA